MLECSGMQSEDVTQLRIRERIVFICSLLFVANDDLSLEELSCKSCQGVYLSSRSPVLAYVVDLRKLFSFALTQYPPTLSLTLAFKIRETDGRISSCFNLNFLVCLERKLAPKKRIWGAFFHPLVLVRRLCTPLFDDQLTVPNSSGTVLGIFNTGTQTGASSAPGLNLCDCLFVCSGCERDSQTCPAHNKAKRANRQMWSP